MVGEKQSGLQQSRERSHRNLTAGKQNGTWPLHSLRSELGTVVGTSDILMGTWGEMYVSELLNMKNLQHIEDFRGCHLTVFFVSHHVYMCDLKNRLT